MAEMLDVVTVGAFNVDQIRQVDQFRPDGEMSSLGTDRAGGGSHANTAVALGRLGHQVAVMGAVGFDAAEKGVLDDLQVAGVGTDGVAEKSDLPTGEALTVTSPAGRSMIITPGANSAFSIVDALAAVRAGAANTRLMHLTSFAEQGKAGGQLAAQEFLVEQLDPEALVSFAPGELYAALGIGQLAVLLSRTDYLIGNPVEISTLATKPEWDYASAARALLDRFTHIRAIAVTLGSGRHRDDYYRSERGDQDTGRRTLIDAWEDSGELDVDPVLSSVIFTRQGRIDTEQVPLTGNVVDPIGAGDAWTAGLLHGILNGYDLQACATMADLVARYSLTGIGARAGLPTLAQLSAALAEATPNSLKTS
jgi:ribokinase